jgi:DNA-binding MltR family transcriptional regulator
MVKRYDPVDVQQAFAQLSEENDRAVILVGGALLENALEQAILSRLREPQTKAERDVLFSERGILGTFSEKITAAYFLKIIGPSVRRDIDLIRAIRNVAAHDMKVISFNNTPGIASRCSELNAVKDSNPGKAEPPDFRGMFILTVQYFTANLLLRSEDSNSEIAGASEQLVAFLDR